MKELKRIVEDIESVFADSSYPRDFLDAYDQMECLASHGGRETFLVQKKDGKEAAVAKCYDRSVFPFRPDYGFLASLTHPGLPRFYGQYQNESMLCIVREYIEGEPLSVYARENPLSIQQIVSLADQLCDILETLHRCDPPIIHRDIKPENIIIRPDGSAALIDFDISRTFKENGENDTVFFGTKGYAPPEQYGFGQTDARTDIYAFGVLLRWLVTGSTRENRNIAINEAMQRIIDRCTAFSPAERFSNVGEVRQALRGVNGKKKSVRLSRLLPAIGAALVFLCAGFAAGRYTDWFRLLPRIAFSEPLIEQAARLQLGKTGGSLTAEDLSRVKRLYIYGTEAYGDPDAFYRQSIDGSTEGPLRTLDDLSLLPNLEEIHIVHQGYVDVSGIAELTHVMMVELKHMRISGVQPIAHVSRLRHAILFDTGLKDVTALENCPWLETLDIGLNDISDLSQIGTHPNVRSLGLMWLKMNNLDGIAAYLPRVQAVMLQHGNIRNLAGLAELPELEAVYVLKEQVEAAEAALQGTSAEIHVTEN